MPVELVCVCDTPGACRGCRPKKEYYCDCEELCKGRKRISKRAYDRHKPLREAAERRRRNEDRTTPLRPNPQSQTVAAPLPPSVHQARDQKFGPAALGGHGAILAASYHTQLSHAAHIPYGAAAAAGPSNPQPTQSPPSAVTENYQVDNDVEMDDMGNFDIEESQPVNILEVCLKKFIIL